MANTDRPAVIHKEGRRPSTLTDYAAARAAFSWSEARRQFAGLTGGGLNIAWEATERHARGARAQHTAIRWLGRDGVKRDISYEQLTRDVNRFANVLRGLGITFITTGLVAMAFMTFSGI